jgi:DNA-binding response OmpR family regulator
MALAWIIDDDEDMGEAIRLMLQLMEYQVQIFVDAKSAAKALLAGQRPDVMILDIMMPEVSGMDFLEYLRRRPEFRRLPVVMLSSETTDVRVEQALKLGADGFVFKPVTFEELEEALQKAIAAR